MDIFEKMARNIIKEQEGIIGSTIAWEQARKVPGLKIDWQKHEVVLVGDKKEIVEKLVEQYEYLFGQASVEVCKDAVKDIVSSIPKAEMPQFLQ